MTMLRTRTTAAAVLSTLALGACVIAPAGYYADDGYGGTIAVADVAPPAPYYEARPVVPYAGAIWISGYWGWRGGRHHWVPGYWERPRPGYTWRPHGWHRHDGRWALRGGGWARGR
jgi:hypothetical protein